MEDFLKFITTIMETKEILTLETRYESIAEWDSLMQLRLVAEIEEKYGVEIPIDEVVDIKTLGDFYKYTL